MFAGVLLAYFWGSAYTKLGEGLFGFLSLSIGAYAQIFPLAMERVGYDPSALSFFHTLVAIAGTWSEFILPLLIVVRISDTPCCGRDGRICACAELCGHRWTPCRRQDSGGLV